MSAAGQHAWTAAHALAPGEWTGVVHEDPRVDGRQVAASQCPSDVARREARRERLPAADDAVLVGKDLFDVVHGRSVAREPASPTIAGEALWLAAGFPCPERQSGIGNALRASRVPHLLGSP